MAPTAYVESLPKATKVHWLERAIPVLMRRARRLTQVGLDEAEDHVQSTVLEALLEPTPGHLTEPEFLRRLTTALRHNISDAARRRRTIPWSELSHSGQINDRTAETRGPVAILVYRERGAELRAALAKLPPAQRQAVELCFLQGHARRRAGALLGRSEDAVQALLARARHRLALHLATADEIAASPAQAD
jgi:RNA polymerase sigma factor (sigma-70 family)